MADIPAGTGLGSSGSFTTALLRALHARQRNVINPHSLAEQACHIEIDLLREPVGKQDQFIAAYGGVTCFEFNTDDSVSVNTAALNHEVLDNLEDGLCLFFTGYSRSASAILKDQDDRSKAKDGSVIDNLHDFFERFKELNIRSNEELDALVAQAQDVVRGIVPQDLRDRDALRWSVAGEMASVQQALDSMLVDRPRRRILRTPQPGAAAT